MTLEALDRPPDFGDIVLTSTIRKLNSPRAERSWIQIEKRLPQLYLHRLKVSSWSLRHRRIGSDSVSDGSSKCASVPILQRNSARLDALWLSEWKASSNGKEAKPTYKRAHTCIGI